jgi:hypothetical protein
MRFRHLVVFFSTQTGGIVTSEPRLYARANQELFEGYDFTDSGDNHPTTHQIVQVLREQGFNTETNQNSGVQIHYKFD